jgi:TPR repeat protein
MRFAVSVFCILLSVTASAQVEISIKKIGPDHVRRMMEIERFEPAREMALQCVRESNDPWCMFYAAQMISAGLGGKKDETEAYSLFVKSAEHSNPAAQATVGNMYHNGLGVDKDMHKAVSWWEKSAENCNSWAQNAVAHSYYDDAILPRDLEKAYYWISLASHFGHTDAAQGRQVVQSSLTSEQVAQIDAKVQKFIATSTCGQEHNPVINYEP